MKAAKQSSGNGWPDLPGEIWTQILQKLPLEDIIRCGSVCKSLSSIARNLNHCSPEPRIPWLMLPSDSHSDNWKFLDVATDKVHAIHLPELRNTVVIGSSHGWLILADEATADLRLFNPFTRAKVRLPPTPWFPSISFNSDSDSEDYVVQDGLSLKRMTPQEVSRRFYKNASVGPGYSVVVTYGVGVCALIAYVKPGEGVWTVLETPSIPLGFFHRSFTVLESLMYVMDMCGEVVCVDLSSSGDDGDLTPCPLPVAPIGPGHAVTEFCGPAISLVALQETGELLHYRWKSALDTVPAGRDIFKVFKLDYQVEEWVEVNSLDGHSLFLASRRLRPHSALSIKLSPQDLKGNCLYLAEGGTLKVFDMKVESSVSNPSNQFSWEVPEDGHSEPLWISPVLDNLAEASYV